MTPIEYIRKLIEDGRCYDLNNGNVAIYHKDIEHMAEAYNVTVDVELVDIDLASKIAVVKATAIKENKKYSTFGEAAQYNNDFAFPLAVAEKRAYDRAVLKALQLHGDVYSWEEVKYLEDQKNDGFQPGTYPYPGNTGEAMNKVKPKLVSISDELIKKLCKAKDITSFNKLLGKHQEQLNRLLKDEPLKAKKIFAQLKETKQQLEKR